MWGSTPDFGIEIDEDCQRVSAGGAARFIGVETGCRRGPIPARGVVAVAKMDDKTPCASDNEEEQFDDEDDEGAGVSSKQLDFECAGFAHDGRYARRPRTLCNQRWMSWRTQCCTHHSVAQQQPCMQVVVRRTMHVSNPCSLTAAAGRRKRRRRSRYHPSASTCRPASMKYVSTRSVDLARLTLRSVQTCLIEGPFCPTRLPG